MTENEISKIIVDAAIEVHRDLGGPGLLEDIYEEAMAQELRLRGMSVERQLPVRLSYKGVSERYVKDGIHRGGATDFKFSIHCQNRIFPPLRLRGLATLR